MSQTSSSYISTRGEGGSRDFESALLAGLAPDGGLFVPEAWPHLTPEKIHSLAGMQYADAAAEIMLPFIGSAIDRATFRCAAVRRLASTHRAAA